MADWCRVLGKGSSAGGGYGRRSMRDDDFEEEDVWSVMKEIGDSGSNTKYPSSGSSFSSAWHLPATAPRMIPTATNHGGKVQSSAPGLEGHSKGEILANWTDDRPSCKLVWWISYLVFTSWHANAICLNPLFSSVLFDKSFGIPSRTCSRNVGAAAVVISPAPLSQTVSPDHFNDREEFRIEKGLFSLSLCNFTIKYFYNSFQSDQRSHHCCMKLKKIIALLIVLGQILACQQWYQNLEQHVNSIYNS
ncbi:hypothetical protein SADUNF_Sadunf04G0007800 [Salix dunnii]|uniref:Uncharacterized protein n=1 Tax=Salix dunnii TaxID=1413687 RepID=A0A835K9T9_9ROSI|nr:hypothetical protein SADUNF_Sadunf04G0007800 [Salix dunnii]